ncbi:MAG TPA: glycosyltransferase family 39 protein [Candidatus Cryosericum sp.]|nr:glycosyltransferase family 39 protein [Candidatus Cryosericum sp.]
MSRVIGLFRSDRSCLVLIAILGLLLCGSGLGGRDLWDPDEPRTAQVTEAIVRSGDWAVLQQEDHLYLEKPPLYYWLAALASLPAEVVDEFSVRLPASVAAILTAVTVFLFGRSLFGRRAGALAALVFLTTFDVVLEARWARPDMLLTLCVTAAAWCFREALDERAPRFWLAGFYLAVGLAVLSKGPVGLLPIPAALVCLAASRRLAFLKRAGVAWGLPLLLLPVSLWLAAWSAGTGRPFPLAVILERFGLRVALGLHHSRPLLHMLGSLPLALFPWVGLLPAALQDAWPRRGQRRDDRTVFLVSFLLVYAALFAMSAEKRGVYLLPILPFQALLVGRLWDGALMEWDPHPLDRPIRWGLALLGAIAVAGSGYYLPLIRETDAALLRPATALCVAFVLSTIVPLVLVRRLGPGRALGAFASGLAVCYVVIVAMVLPAVDLRKSARPLATRVAAVAGGDPVAIYPDDHPGLAWYARRPITVLSDRLQLREFLGSAPRALCLMEEATWQTERSGLPAAQVVERGSVGHRSLVLVRAGT